MDCDLPTYGTPAPSVARQLDPVRAHALAVAGRLVEELISKGCISVGHASYVAEQATALTKKIAANLEEWLAAEPE